MPSDRPVLVGVQDVAGPERDALERQRHVDLTVPGLAALAPAGAG
jgi:hypothetical protein